MTYGQLLQIYFSVAHDPTQMNRQGPNVGSQYRSVIYAADAAQQAAAEASRALYQQALTAAHRAAITTEIIPAPVFYYAEGYHQQYLHKNPNGYCGIGGCGVTFAVSQ